MTDPIKDGGPAFPVPDREASDQGVRGMSLRDWFAGQAVAGLIASDAPVPGVAKGRMAELLAVTAYRIADEMIEARKDA